MVATAGFVPKGRTGIHCLVDQPMRPYHCLGVPPTITSRSGSAEHPERTRLASGGPTDPPAGPPTLRGWLHAIGFVAIIIAGPFLVAAGHGGWEKFALAVYVISVAALFGVSASFHRITWSAPARRRMRRADHSTIFVAIAGTYTAVAGIALSGLARVLVLSLVWGGACIGILLRQLWLDAPKWAVALPYVVVGWSALTVLPQLFHRLGGTGFALLLAGGLAYTAGAVVYAVRRPDPYPRVFGYHEIFHTCTVVGAVLHFVMVARFVLPHG